jgi:transcription initiation factor TFIID subunit 12
MNPNDRQILTKAKLQEIMKEIDPKHLLDPEVEDILLQVADDFIENNTIMGCAFAKHRASDTLEVKDLQLSLERNWNINIPGYGTETLKPYKKPLFTEAHKQNVATVKKMNQQSVKDQKKKPIKETPSGKK